MIRAIVAMDIKQGIADDRGMPWRLPKEHQHFKESTQGTTVIMGYNTYLTFKRPLRNRRNIVWCQKGTVLKEGFYAFENIEDLLLDTTEDMWIIGGATLYASTLRYCKELYITRINRDFNCTKFFPRFDDEFELVSRSKPCQEGGIEYAYERWARRMPKLAQPH